MLSVSLSSVAALRILRLRRLFFAVDGGDRELLNEILLLLRSSNDFVADVDDGN